MWNSWKLEGFGSECCPKKFLLFYLGCCQMSLSWAFVRLCRISCCQVNLLFWSLKSHSSPSVLSAWVLPTWAWKIGLDWIGGDMFEWKYWPLFRYVFFCLAFGVRVMVWKWWSLACDLEMVSIISLWMHAKSGWRISGCAVHTIILRELHRVPSVWHEQWVLWRLLLDGKQSDVRERWVLRSCEMCWRVQEFNITSGDSSGFCFFLAIVKFARFMGTAWCS